MFGYLTAGLSAALFLAILFGWYEHKENVHLQVAVDTYKANEATITAANKKQSAAITVLEQRLGKAAGVKQQVERARDAALAQQADTKAALVKAQALAKTLRGKLYAADAASRSWAFSPVPGVLAGQLCDEWTSAGGDGGKGCGRAPSSVRPDSTGAARNAEAGPAATASVLPVDCSAGCFSNDQLLGALDDALTWGLACRGQLQAIDQLSRTAVDASTVH